MPFTTTKRPKTLLLQRCNNNQTDIIQRTRITWKHFGVSLLSVPTATLGWRCVVTYDKHGEYSSPTNLIVKFSCLLLTDHRHGYSSLSAETRSLTRRVLTKREEMSLRHKKDEMSHRKRPVNLWLYVKPSVNRTGLSQDDHRKTNEGQIIMS